MQFHHKMNSIYPFIPLLNLKQNKPAPCSYFGGPLASGAQDRHSTNKDIKSLITQASSQLNICSLPAVNIFGLSLCVCSCPRQAHVWPQAQMINLFPVHYWLILPRGRNETLAEFNGEFAPPPASIHAVCLNFPALPLPRPNAK